MPFLGVAGRGVKTTSLGLVSRPPGSGGSRRGFGVDTRGDPPAALGTLGEGARGGGIVLLSSSLSRSLRPPRG
eukprot:12242514-Alexandrium_andersonii.AAC.1